LRLAEETLEYKSEQTKIHTPKKEGRKRGGEKGLFNAQALKERRKIMGDAV
jgi:hypothetical protein